MLEEFPSNSRRVVPNKEEAPREKRVAEKIVTGKVVVRKTSLGRRLMNTFFSGDSTSVFGYLLKEVLVPALQATATDMVTQGIEKAVYGEVRTPRGVSRTTASGRPHISYNQVNTAARTAPSSISRRPITRTAGFDLGEIILESKVEVDTVLEQIFETMEEYDGFSVADLKGWIGKTSEYTDHNWGWTMANPNTPDLITAKRIREGYLLILPPVEDLRAR